MENIDCVKIYLTYSNVQCGKAYVILATVKRHIIQLKTSHRTAGTETTTSVVITTKKISYHIKWDSYSPQDEIEHITNITLTMVGEHVHLYLFLINVRKKLPFPHSLLRTKTGCSLQHQRSPKCKKSGEK